MDCKYDSELQHVTYLIILIHVGVWFVKDVYDLNKVNILFWFSFK